MKRLLGFLGLLLAAGACDTLTPAVGNTETLADDSDGKAHLTLTTLLGVNFDAHPLGMLGAMWAISVEGGSSVAVASTSDHGNVLKLHGSTAEGEFIAASTAISSSAKELHVQVDVRPDSGASFVWQLNGSGPAENDHHIRLQRAPGTTRLVASASPNGNSDCGPLPSATWSTITLVVHTNACAQQTFDVLVNGMGTLCSGIATGMGPPYTAVLIMDPSNPGWGGDVLFDNIVVTTP
jgi:hypothetical protein